MSVTKRILACVISVFLSSIAIAEPPARPNILVLMAEDMSARVGAFGDEVAVTPNIDRLASEGVRYPNTFTTAGVCAPSRAAHITGMHQNSFGGQHMRTASSPLGSYRAVPPPQVKAYPELLRAAGYYTWTGRKLDYQFSGPMANSGPFSIWDQEGGAGHWRNRRPDKPFFGLVNFNVTHESRIFGSAKAIAVPRELEVSPNSVEVPPYYPDTAAVRTDIARHYNNIAKMDRQVGEVLQQLEAEGLADSTIVIWTTDHGDGLPRAKRDLFDAGIKVPMIIRWPRAYRPEGVIPGSIDTRLVSFVDLAPTLLRLAGVSLPAYLQGRDIVIDQSRDYIYASRDRIDEVTDRQRAVRDKRYKYIRSWYPQQPGGHHLAFRDNLKMMGELWQLLEEGKLNDQQRQWFEPPGKERLFDLREDPFELNNLAADPAHRATLERMRAALAAWQGEVQDWGEQSEAEMVASFQPGGKVPTTEPPEISFRAGKLTLSSNTSGASMGYRINGGQWQLYSRPVDIAGAVEIQAKAVRYGWDESEVTIKTSP